ncbi:hypothetical protein PL263_17445 [Methylomonas sp. EFPC3]|nr:hypothetical protein [Methylomonas sp. EFPC3]WFP49872.1 hypothetical protein PL263_17445 [Methylomonas sp. EFPC3]
MPQISSNDLKTKGIAAIESGLANAPEVVVSVRAISRVKVPRL